MKKISSLLAAWVGCAMSCFADESRFDVLASTDGVNFSPSVNVAAGASGKRVYVAYVISYVGTAATPNAFASLAFQPVFSNIRIGFDSVVPFANQGNNTNGGAIDGRTDYSLPGGFGRLKPWAATGPSTSQSYVVHVHSGTSAGAPVGTYLRIARQDVTRWVGTGATTGTAAVNNFNGVGGVTAGQKQAPGAADPPRVSGTSNLVLMVLALDVDQLTGAPFTIIAGAPTLGMTRNATTGVREASWWANTTENTASIKAPVVVHDALINVLPCTPPVIASISPAITACVGQSASLSVSASNGALSYQWRRQGVAIPGAQSETLTLAAVTPSDEGSYDCLVSNSCGTSTTPSTRITVEQPLVFTLQPQSTQVCIGGSAQLSVGISGSATASYQWRKEGLAIPGATSSLLTISNFDLSQAGSYDCAVTTVCGVRISEAATIGTNGVQGAFITSGPAGMSVCEGALATLAVTAIGTEPVAYQWYRNGAILVGETARQLTFNATAQHAGVYTCVASNSCRSDTSSTAIVQVDPPARITTQPGSINASIGSAVTLSVSATGGSSLQYRWFHNGQPLVNDGNVGGATTSVLSIVSLRGSDLGRYRCDVRNACGTISSNTVDVSTSFCPPSWVQLSAGNAGTRWFHAQAFDRLSQSTVLFGGRDLDGDPVGETRLLKFNRWESYAGPEPSPRSDHAMVSIGDSGVLLFGGKQTADDASASGETWLWNGSGWALVADTGPSPRGGHSMVFDSLRNKVVLFGGFDAQSNLLQDTWEWDGVAWTQVASDGPAARVGAAAAFDPASGTTLVFGGYGDTTLGDTWLWNGTSWRLAAVTGPSPRYYAAAAFEPSAGRVVLVAGADALVQSDVWQWTGDGWSPLSPSGTFTSRWGHAVAYDEAQKELVVVGGAGPTFERFADCWAMSRFPVITVQPEPMSSGCIGQWLYAGADSSSGLSYSWRRNGVLVGSNSSLLYLNSPSDSGNYSCTVQNTCGQSVSRSVAVVVNSPLQIVQQPLGGIACLGSRFEMSVSASGGGLRRYQWYRDSVPIPGATEERFVISSMQADDERNYFCGITSDCGALYSASVQLRWEYPIAPAVLPDIAQCVSTVYASASCPSRFGLTFQWRRAGIPIPGATASYFPFSTADQSDSYDCVVSGVCGSVTTNSFRVRLDSPARVASQPPNVDLCPGEASELFVAAIGTEPIHYQWERYSSTTGWVPVGGSSPRLAIGGADVGTYRCGVSNQCGAQTTGDIQVQRYQKPVLSSRSPDASVALNAGVSIGVGIYQPGPQSPLTYRWHHNGVPLDDAPDTSGTTTPTLTLSSIRADQQGAYSCRVSSICTSVVTYPINVSVSQCPTGWYSAGLTGAGERWVHAQAFDSIGQGTLLFGGRDRFGRTLRDTWRLEATGWQQVATTGPSVRSDHAMVSMGNAGILLFGGKATGADSSVLGDTWLWNGSQWTQVAADGPAPRGGHSMAFDSARQRVVLFGGFGANSSVLSDLWEWDGTAWTQRTTSGPSARFAAAMAFDPSREHCVLFGGYSGGLLGDSWTWDGTAWTQRSAGGASPRYYATAAFDDSLGRVVLRGGAGAAAAIYSDEYTWFGDGWNVLSRSPAGPARWTHAMSFDPALQRMILTGGAGAALTRYADAWQSTGGPLVVAQPRSVAACSGAPASFVIQASGPAPLTYAWSFNGSAIEGATSSTYTIPVTSPAHVGSYACTVRNACGSIVSLPASLAIAIPAAVISSPQTQSVCPGQTATFDVQAIGDPAPTYQWRRDGSPIVGATSASLVITNAGPTSQAVYDCVVSNSCSTAYSQPASLLLQVPVSITGHPTPVLACPGSPVSFVVEASGLPAPSYQWMRDGLPLSGATEPVLSIPAASIVDIGSYACVISNPCTTATSQAASLSLRQPVMLSQQPDPVTICSGQTATMHVAADGTGPLTYQWRRNGLSLPGQVSSALELSATPELAGSYDCIITNSCGSIQSASADLTVRSRPILAAQPLAAAACPGSSASFFVTILNDTDVSYQWRFQGQSIPGAVTSTLQRNSIAEADAGSYDCIITNACGSTISSPAILTLNAAPVILASPVSRNVCPGEPFELDVQSNAVPAATFKWFLDGRELVGQTAARLAVPAASPATAGSYRCVVSNVCGSAQTSSASVVLLDPPSITAHPADQAECDGLSATFAVFAAGTGPLHYQWRFNGGPIEGATSRTYTSVVSPTSTGMYDCIVSNTCGQVVSQSARLRARQSPTVVSQPAGASICAGGTATLVIDAAGEMPMAFQWRHNGVELPGETASVLNLSAAGRADAGLYECVISNPCGSVTSNAAVLAVAESVQIADQPRSVPLSVGSEAVFAVATTGGQSPIFQWRKAGVAMVNGGRFAGTTTPTLHISAVQASDEASYDCVITDHCGDAVTDPALLTCKPIFSSHPEGGSYAARTSVQLSATVDAIGVVTYRWKKDGFNLFNSPIYSGVQSTTLTINSTDPSQTGEYTLVASKSCGSTTSRVALVVFSCVSDFNQDGGVDGSDIEAFFSLWEAGDSTADVNQDGGVDGSDVDVFFTAWESGC